MSLPRRQIRSPAGLKVLERVRGITSRLPEVTEAIDKFGHTSFRVRDKPFVIMGEESEGPSLSLKTDPYTQERLVQDGEFSRTPYIGQHGWVSLRGLPPRDWDPIETLILDAYRRTAPKRLREQLGGG